MCARKSVDLALVSVGFYSFVVVCLGEWVLVYFLLDFFVNFGAHLHCKRKLL